MGAVVVTGRGARRGAAAEAGLRARGARVRFVAVDGGFRAGIPRKAAG